MKKIYFFILSFFLFSVSNSQVLDSSFGINGKFVTNTGQFSSNMFIHGGYIDPQGRIIVGETNIDDEGYNFQSTISAFTASGNMDTTFGYGGIIVTNANAQGGYLTHQSNNKIISAGVYKFDRFDPYGIVSVERFSLNGLRDSSFGINGIAVIDRPGVSQQVFCTTVDAQDNIYVGGAVYAKLNGANHFTVVRFKPGGKLDTSFYILNATKYEDKCYSLNVLADGSVIAGYLYNNFKSACLAKYKPNGKRDLSFGINGIVPFNTNCSSGNFLHTVVLSDGSILSATGNSDKIWFYKVSPSGQPDNSFGTHGVAQTNDLINGFSTYSHYFSVDSSNRILLPLANFQIKRLLPNGQTDSSFGTNGYVATDIGNGLPGAFELAIVQGNSFFGIGHFTDFTSSEFGIAKYANTSSALIAANKDQNNVTAEKISNRIKIFPNPVNNLLHVTGLNDKSNIIIADAKGNVVIKNYAGQPSLNIDVHQLIPGIYYLIIDNGWQTIKFIKE
jgi:uncharacterized delta-60 repeat protein